ncbi:MAG: DEAD/DEAH box helicase [Phycisphaerales bacterium]
MSPHDDPSTDVPTTIESPEAASGEEKPKKRRRRGGKGRKRDGKPASETDTADAVEGGDEGEVTSEAVAAKPERPAREKRPEPVSEPAPASAPKKQNDIFGAAESFAELGLRNSVLKGVDAAGFKRPTKIQAELIPPVLEGRDVLGQAKTGSGKTAAFGLPLFHMATRGLPFQSLVLVPTRELAQQVAGELQEFGQFTPIKVSAVFGGESVRNQARDLEAGPEIIVATPGRLIDMLDRGVIHLRNTKFVVLDEVDRMLDIGFRDDIKRILSNIKTEHRTIFVSATISEEIEKLARSYMHDPVKIVSTSGALTVSLVEQHHLPVLPWDKRRLLLHLLTHEEPALTVVFCRTKRTVDDVADYLKRHRIDAHAIHGDMQQSRRNRVMHKLRDGKLEVLVASDLAARGLDVDNITHVINYDLPEDPEVYVHRIGRTARAGRGGVAWSFVVPDQGELLTNIEMLANVEIPKLEYPDFTPSPPREDRPMRPTGPSAPTSAPSAGGPPPRERGERPERGERGGRDRGPAPEPKPAPQAPASGGKTNRFDVAIPGPKTSADAFRFPDGLVPTKLPPRRMQGRVKTTRSNMGSAPVDE